MTTTQQDFPLMDGVQRNREHPDTFEIPDADRRNNLASGEFVKIGLCDPERGAERFWVEVTGRTDAGYTAKVRNLLVRYPELPFDAGITFRPEHVLATE